MRESMVTSRSPLLTNAPSVKLTESMNPLTCALTSTESTASRRPTNSSHWVTLCTMGLATVTCTGGGGGAATGFFSPHPAIPANAAHAAAVNIHDLCGTI